MCCLAVLHYRGYIPHWSCNWHAVYAQFVQGWLNLHVLDTCTRHRQQSWWCSFCTAGRVTPSVNLLVGLLASSTSCSLQECYMYSTQQTKHRMSGHNWLLFCPCLHLYPYTWEFGSQLYGLPVLWQHLLAVTISCIVAQFKISSWLEFAYLTIHNKQTQW